MTEAIDSQAVLDLIAAAPSVRPFFMRLARAAAKGKRLPETFSVKGIDSAAQLRLEQILRTRTKRMADGTVSGSLPPPLSEPSAWLALAAALGVTAKTRAETPEDFLLRLKWQAPDAWEALEDLAAQPEVMRHLKDEENRADWKRLFLSVRHLTQHLTGEFVTLSQLGSDLFNDSKILREGPLRRQLALIIAALAHIETTEEKEIFAQLGIEANPYTSAVTVFAPFVFKLFDGATFDFPLRLYRQGLVCQLPAETVLQIDRIAWRGEQKKIATSENAAPLVRFVSARRPVLYTEGYPNYAVLMMMKLLDEQGVVAEHWGDADLDGLQIAELVQGNMSCPTVVASSILANPGGLTGIPLTAAQRERIERFLERQPTSPLANDARLLLERNCWYEQESFPFERGKAR